MNTLTPTRPITTLRDLTLILIPMLAAPLWAQHALVPIQLQRNAIRLYQSGEYQAAIPLYAQLIRERPSDNTLQRDYLILLWLGGHYQEAAGVGAKADKQDTEAQFIYARSLLAVGRTEDALAVLKHCRTLAPGEKNIRLAEARTDGLMRNYDSALPKMLALKRRYPDFKELYPQLARLQQAMENYPDAADSWARAMKDYPENNEYKFHHAECLYYSGQFDPALKEFSSLSSPEARFWPALDFQIDDALATGQVSVAQSLLEENLQTLEIDDGSRVIKLARLYQAEKRYAAAINLLDRWLSDDPSDGQALTLKAECLEQNGQKKAALQIYEQITTQNPSEIKAWLNIADLQDEFGHNDQMLQAANKALALDPTDPYLLLQRDRYLEDTPVGTTGAVLADWVTRHPEPAIPVLVFHGLTPRPRDPMLAYDIHRSVATFDEQMRALRDSHLTPITAAQINAWVHGSHHHLPHHSILITFDDGRLDSFKYGDPVLQKYGLKATMFAPMVSVDGYIPRYISWKEMKPYLDNGRWELQSHGDQAHRHIVIDEAGHRGLFLINRAWINKTLEPVDDWTARVHADHVNSQKKILAHTETAANAYAFPEGNYGQDELPNDPQAAAMNLKEVRRVFGSAYHQDGYGFNVRSRDPALLTRFYVPPTMSGQGLVHHITDETPAIRMIHQLLKDAIANGNLGDAQNWYHQLEIRDVSRSCLWSNDARIQLAQGNWQGAQELANKAFQEDPSSDNQELLREIHQAGRYRWWGGFSYQNDSHDRQSERFRQDLGYWRTGGWEWSAHHIFGIYHEGGVENVTENGGGIGLGRQVSAAHYFYGEATGHFLSAASSSSTYSVLGRAESVWSPTLNSELELGRSISDNARAIDANVYRRYADAELNWTPAVDWKGALVGRFENLSDANDRQNGQLYAGRRVLWPRLWLLGRINIDNYNFTTPNYYSPEVLNEYQAGLEYTADVMRHLNAYVQYLPGYGKEKNSNGEFVQDIVGRINYTIGSLTLSPEVDLIRDPSYHRDTYSLNFDYRF